jgi:hypothetical protein
MNCAVCNRPLFEGATACIVCGAPVAPPQPIATAPTQYGYGPPPPSPYTAPIIDSYAPSPPPAGYAPQAAYAPQPGPGIPPPPPLVGYPPPAPYYPQAPVVGDRNNALAVASFICGILGLVPFWIGFVLCIAAMVLGGFALQHANRLPDHRGRGLAIAGLVLGIVFILPASCGL